MNLCVDAAANRAAVEKGAMHHERDGTRRGNVDSAAKLRVVVGHSMDNRVRGYSHLGVTRQMEQSTGRIAGRGGARFARIGGCCAGILPAAAFLSPFLPQRRLTGRGPRGMSARGNAWGRWMLPI